mgnify:CR=1 FL=1
MPSPVDASTNSLRSSYRTPMKQNAASNGAMNQRLRVDALALKRVADSARSNHESAILALWSCSLSSAPPPSPSSHLAI